MSGRVDLVEIQRGPNWLFIALDAAKAGSSPPRLADRVESLLDRHFVNRVVLEIKAPAGVDEDLAADLAELARRVSRRDGMLRICGLSQPQRASLRRRGLHRHHLNYGDRRAAVFGDDWHPKKPR